MTGFTSGTRKHGIVHVARRPCGCQLSLPIMHANGALFVGTEGDNLIVLLPNAISAVSAAVGMRDAILRHNAALSGREHHRVSLGGIGLHCGGPVVLDEAAGALRGPVASLAYHIGEDVSPTARFASAAVVKPARRGGRGARAQLWRGGDGLARWACMRSRRRLASAAALPAADDGTFLHASLLPLARRHDAALRELDAELGALLQPAAVLMFRIIDRSDPRGCSTADAETGGGGGCAARCAARAWRFDGIELEPCLWLFQRADAAAAAAAKDAVRAAPARRALPARCVGTAPAASRALACTAGVCFSSRARTCTGRPRQHREQARAGPGERRRSAPLEMTQALPARGRAAMGAPSRCSLARSPSLQASPTARTSHCASRPFARCSGRAPRARARTRRSLCTRGVR